ncbi:hypothetical protein HD554DRAFT_2124847 [Boletus coccyginus]|nr:hypothetical protein HD554DRAFT_2124847 [Boletus coccyginus]
MDEHEIETLQRQLCLSRPLSIRTRSMERWTSLSGDTEQGPMEGSDGQLEGAGSVLVHYRSVSVFALAKMAWRVDVLGTSRWVSTVRGWGDFTFVRNVSLANRAAHVIDHRLFANDRPGTIVRTGLSTTEHRPIVIVIASVTGRPFDYDALVACILSCIDLDLGTPQHLGLLCAIPRKAKEMVVTLNDTLHLIIDILEYHGLEVGNVSVDELDVGYWVQMTVFLRVQLEDQVPDVFVADREQYEQGVSVPLDANPHASAEGLV